MNRNKIDAVILAGGKGSRISKHLKNIPKPLYNFSGISLLKFLINNISKYNINRIYIIGGYRGEKIYKYFHDTIVNFVKIHCIIEKEPLGTGGSLNLIKNKISKNFLLFNGDTIFDIDIKKFISQSKKNKINIAVTNNNSYLLNKKLNNIDIDKNKILIRKQSKKINGGIYYLNKKIFSLIKPKCSLENDILPNEINKKNVIGIYFKNFFIDIGTPANLILSKKIIPSFFKKPAFFFDRDGTINEDEGYTHKYKSFQFKPHVIKALKYLSQKNVYIFIVTNQAGIAKGIFSEKDFYKLHAQIKKYLLKKNIFINDVVFCPYHPQGRIIKYKKNSMFRKPGNLMIEKIFQNWLIIRSKSCMIGDSFSDKEAAIKSNLYFEFAQPNLLTQVQKICKKFKI
jgi:D,D-heptose 1,7-bisphosphate phosphatase